PERYVPPTNTGVPTGQDIDNDGKAVKEPGSRGYGNDAQGFGQFPGQYGMLILSKYPIEGAAVQQFGRLLWKDMPGASLPRNEDGTDWYSPQALAVLRLSSKNHVDVPIRFGERFVHLLASHPTPPAFDGPERRNARRNHDEIRLWADYIDPTKSEYIVDDAGKNGGLPDGTTFVIVGDLNCDPIDGEGVPGTMDQLLKNPKIDGAFVPISAGGPMAVKANAEQNAGRKGDPTFVTSDFGGEGHGNFRLDYVLPSKNLKAIAGGIFWPAPGEPGAMAITASDHRSVWIDIVPVPASVAPLPVTVPK
ncbi:MAG TPA: endonuclease/exonuclease/phosphatase family protein, partial [Planctomycetaceae bacterium]